MKINYKGECLNISYFIRNGESKAILYIHGLGCSKDDFLNATEIKSLNSYTLIGFDFPGHGSSDYIKNGKLGIDDLVEITKLFVNELNIKNFISIGHSMGGLVATLYAEKYSDDVNALINVEGNLSSEDCFLSRQISEMSFDEFKEKMFNDIISKLSESENVGMKSYANSLRKYKPIKAFYDYSPSLVNYSDKGSMIDRFLELKMPKIFIYGEENKDFSYLPKLKNVIDVIEIEGSGHFPQCERADEFYNIVTNYIKIN